MKEKTCFKCDELKNISEFYKHKLMSDGHLGKCKQCTKKDVSENYFSKKTYYQQYEKDRAKTASRREQQRCARLAYREKYPEKYKARTAVGNAVRDGRLIKMPCSTCGCKKVEAHHDDYSKPLEVKWFCVEHHVEHEKT